jgi:diguanylate cyclase (GGDEF)-like protein
MEVTLVHASVAVGPGWCVTGRSRPAPHWRSGCGSLLPIVVHVLLNGTLLAGTGAVPSISGNENTIPITTARAAHDISLQEAAQQRPVRLRAVVTYYDPYLDPRWPAFFVNDASGSIFVVLASFPAVPLKPGELVEVTGTTGTGEFAPIVDHARARVIGQSHLPSTASRTGVNNLLNGDSDGRWVEVEGVVHAVREVGQNVLLDLAAADGPLTAFTVKDPAVDFSRLVDSKILVRGNDGPLFNHQGQMTGNRLFFSGMATLRVEDPAEPNPFGLPLQDLKNLLRFQPKSGLLHRLHVRGVVTLLWPGRMICLQDGEAGICAQTGQMGRLNLGDTVDLIGFPVIGGFTPTMAASVYRRSAGGRPAQPFAITPAQAMSGLHDSQLVTIDGQLIDMGRDGVDPAMILSAGGQVFTVSSLEGSSKEAKSMERGTWLRVTGICSVQVDTSQNLNLSGYSLAKSFRILQRSRKGDTVVLHRPSWWNSKHSLSVLAVATLIAAAAMAGVLILRRRVKEQTAVIREQLAESIALKEAAEYQATHDELTGLINRKAIFDLLSREFASQSWDDCATGIIMMDLDHFKRVNDTYGHAAGDAVLRETAKRLLESVRVTDYVGRYGGEEFLIVLPDSDLSRCQACAERIRLAIASLPISVDGILLAMTASLGMVVAVSQSCSEQQALIAADTALYQAKRKGRNQVATVDSRVPLAIAAVLGP